MMTKGYVRVAMLVAWAAVSIPSSSTGGDPARQSEDGKNLYAAVFSVRGSVSGRSTGGFGVFVREDIGWRQITLSNVFTFGLGFFENAGIRRHYIAGGNGLHRSTDGGDSWRILTSWETMEVLSVVPHPVDSAVIYIATPWGVYKTVDDGQTWVEKMNGMRRWYVEDLLMDARETNTLYAGSEDGLYRTTDGGELWEPMGVGDSAVLVVMQHPMEHDLLLAGLENGGIRFTTDGGTTWQSAEGTDGDGVFESRDRGKTWHHAGLEGGKIKQIAIYPGKQ
jgi:photosystem II stability/assembly factor-like uncharacterized protein